MKEIFWGDYNIDEKKAIEMIKNGSEYEKRFIFGKIIANSNNIIKDLEYFDKEDLKELLTNFKVPNFNRYYLGKRVCIAKNYFLDEPCKIKELQWMI